MRLFGSRGADQAPTPRILENGVTVVQANLGTACINTTVYLAPGRTEVVYPDDIAGHCGGSVTEVLADFEAGPDAKERTYSAEQDAPAA